MAIARIALPVAARSPFDYWIPDGLGASSGAIVRVRLGRRALVGVVVEIAEAALVPREKLQPVIEVVWALPPLPPDLMAVIDTDCGAPAPTPRARAYR